MGASMDPSGFSLLNIDAGDERRRARNSLESSLSPDPCHIAFAFAFHSGTSNLDVCEILVMGPDEADARLGSLLILTDMENRLTIHYAFMDLRRCRAYRKMLHEHGSGNLASKHSVPIAQIVDDALSRPTHGRMTRFDGCGLGSAEEPQAYDEESDCQDDELSESHNDPFHNRRRLQSQV